MQSDFWIMRPFNTLFIASFALFLFLLILASLLLHNKETKTKDAVLITACVITLIGFVIYKICLSRDHDFNAITASMGGFNWWGWIPFPFLYRCHPLSSLGCTCLQLRFRLSWPTEERIARIENHAEIFTLR